jgi:hypothetical protein
MFDLAATIALGAPASVLIWFNKNKKLSLTFIEFEVTNNELFQLQELSDKVVNCHRFLL